ncbi:MULTISPECIES: CheR family methyltransferase [unclassified Modestobacter]|uniref:CheR family methyltransferase n=1 Tax=unclassified Modestobacter TaxID=2643866 RepID=UPI0022AACD23|nr:MULTISPECIES: protein-glutamate O-methyltransferase CheR [unclassified Modestobacter]MCZ2811000.1 protein-glutamate O-methyltransferase CheR [Modestobacter sp. VKM Ac-2979]MCZ2840513.1 protein-glutamate O-methyltransferase CheR [Modestobacter sp. VKM Ac-2980]MCZ2849640.1 protein-glutamate O-methyltransferase CheR [Modestobacter sp. VKM Ac-2978]
MTLTATSFDWVRQLVHRESAIVLQPGKEYLVEARLLPMAQQRGLSGVSELVESVRSRPDPATTRRIVEALTTNETSWFRDGDPFTALTSTVLPQLLAARRPDERLQIWSAACSSGQEAYTIAMLLSDAMPNAATRVSITATDLSRQMVERTRAGRFSQLEVNRGLPATMLVRHFTRSGNEWEIAPALRRMITATECNLAAPLPRMGPFDVVYLRNVLIYFDLPTKQAILTRVRQLMRPDGWLFLGAAETTLGVDENWERVVLGRGSAYRPRKGA